MNLSNVLLGLGLVSLLAAGVMFYQDQNRPDPETLVDVSISYRDEYQAGGTYPLTLTINNRDTRPLRIVGLTWC